MPSSAVIRIAIAVCAALSAVGCASTSVNRGSGGAGAVGIAQPGAQRAQPQVSVRSNAPMVGAVELNLQGAMPAVGGTSAAAVASDFSIGDRRSPIRYQVSYALSPGDVLSSIGSNISRAPTGIARQRTRQQISLNTPALMGAPVRLNLSAETSGSWTTGGGYRASQRERAELRWSKKRADVTLQWSGVGVQNDQTTALNCDLQGTVRLPFAAGHGQPGRSLNFSGRDCAVGAPRAAQLGLGATFWGVGHAWTESGLESEIRLSMISPLVDAATIAPVYDPGFELDLRHSRQYGSWRASARVAMRQSASIAYLPADAGTRWPGGSEPHVTWAADTSLARELKLVSLSASWTHGADPLWFLGDAGARTDRLGLGLDLSEIAAQWLPEYHPQLAVRWRWSQTQSGLVSQRTASELAVSMSVRW